MGLKRMKVYPKYGDMFNLLSFVRNLSAPLSFMVQSKFACTTIIYGAGKFTCTTIFYGAVEVTSPLSCVNDKTCEIEICLYHYHLWCRTNLPVILIFIPFKIFLFLHRKLEWKSIPANVIFRVYNGLEKNESIP